MFGLAALLVASAAAAFGANAYAQFRAESARRLAIQAKRDRESALRERFVAARERFEPALLSVKQNAPLFPDQLTPDGLSTNRERLKRIIADANTMIECAAQLEKEGFELTEPNGLASAKAVVPFLQKMDAVLALLQASPGKFEVRREEGIVFDSADEQEKLRRLMREMMVARPRSRVSAQP